MANQVNASVAPGPKPLLASYPAGEGRAIEIHEPQPLAARHHAGRQRIEPKAAAAKMRRQRSDIGHASTSTRSSASLAPSRLPLQTESGQGAENWSDRSSRKSPPRTPPRPDRDRVRRAVPPRLLVLRASRCGVCHCAGGPGPVDCDGCGRSRPSGPPRFRARSYEEYRLLNASMILNRRLACR